jgi:glutamate racemase
MIPNNPIGILDSGVGGLTVLKNIVSLLPNESTVFIGDSLNTPYGTKTTEEIYSFSRKMIDFLLEKRVKIIVIACNTITVSCLDQLRKDYPGLPIVGTVPVIKTAVSLTKTKRIGVLSTKRTAESQYQKNLILSYSDGVHVVNVGTNDLVPLIEKGICDGEELEALLRSILLPFQKEQIDTLALGCTHFPLLQKKIQAILGTGITLLDSGAAIARQVHRILLQNNAEALLQQKASSSFFTTGERAIAKKMTSETIRMIYYKKIIL